MNARITTLPGDGCGPEVVAEAVKVLRAIAARYKHRFAFDEAPIGGAAIDRAGNPLPPETLTLCRGADAVLLGAVGGPKWSDPHAKMRPEQGLLSLRKELGLYANLRPVKVHRELIDASPLKAEKVADVDLVVVRELTGGIYFGPREEACGTSESAYDTMLYSANEVRRIAALAFDLARDRKKKVTSVDKANVLATSRLWRRAATETAQDYPDVTLEHTLVDSAAMHLLRSPRDFDVILTTNLFGDILTDEASMLTGSLGMLPSACLGDGRLGVYEPIHGSAPDIAGQGIVNPLGTILSAALLLRHSLGLEQEALNVEDAVEGVLAAGLRTADIHHEGTERVTTTQMGDLIAERINHAK
jgi:3-isopropylmalate dehydrogenase